MSEICSPVSQSEASPGPALNFGFTTAPRFPQDDPVRRLFIFVGFALCAAAAHAQEQENKLIDRLLRPDTSLGNSAQDKKFVAADGTPADKKFVAKSFYSGDGATTRSFAGGKNFTAEKFRSRKFFGSKAAPNSTARTIIPNANTQVTTKGSSLIRTARERGKTARVRAYPDNRPFLVGGTRQKALSQEDKPLTIDEVRELLNKSR